MSSGAQNALRLLHNHMKGSCAKSKTGLADFEHAFDKRDLLGCVSTGAVYATAYTEVYVCLFWMQLFPEL